MPCKACRHQFRTIPCEHKTGIDGKPIDNLIHKFTPEYEYGYLKFVSQVYKELHFNCPCSECLTKMMCNLRYEDRCDEYKNLVDKIRDIYYDHSYGRYRKQNELEG